jgi:hypothetical protein
MAPGRVVSFPLEHSFKIGAAIICDLRGLVFRGMPRRAVWLCP